MSAPPAEPQRHTATERLLRIFTDVRPGEGRIALLLLTNVLLLLCAYYMVKPLREGWLAVSIVQGLSKMELKAYSGFGQSLTLVGLMMLYGKLATRWPRRVLITRSTLFCMANMVVFWILQPDFFVQNLPGTGFAFYLWVGMFGIFIVAQFWAFAADLFDDDTGRRLIPLVALGATGGAVIGSWLSERLVASWIPTEHLLLAALVPLALALALTHRVIHLQPVGSRAGPSQEPAAPADAPGPLDLVFRNGTLLGIGAVTLLLSWVNTNGENILFRVVQEVIEADLAAAALAPDVVQAQVREQTTLFYSDFFFWVNAVALALQAFVASRLLRIGGFATLFLLAPLVAFLSYGTMALMAVLPVIKAAKVAENATDYSLTNTARHVFWLPFPRDVTFRAKPTVDSLFARLGDGAAALTVLLGTHALALELSGYLTLNLALISGWLVCAVWLVRRRRVLVEAAARPVVEGAPA